MNSKNYQLFSERCSGSNFLESLLSANFQSLQQTKQYGHKHWVIKKFLKAEEFPENLIFIILNRNPFEWLRSIHKKTWHTAPHLRNLDFSDFIRAEWICVWDELSLTSKNDPRWMAEMMHERNYLNENRRFKNILEVRRVKYKIWQERLIQHPRTFTLSYEEFKKSPHSFVTKLAELEDLEKPISVKIPMAYKGKTSWRKK